MKKFLFSVSLFFLSYVGFSQAELQIQSKGSSFYVTHTVAAKENFYSVGRLFNIPPKEIAAFNNLDMNVGLNVGQTVMVPLTESNFSQTSAKGTPVYYVVGEKEGLYRVSVKNNKVQMENLRKWNNLTSDNISTGSKLIVGYLTATEAASNNPSNTASTSPASTPQSTNNTTTQAPTVTAQPKTDKPVEEKGNTEEKSIQKTATTNTVAPLPTTNGDAGFFKSEYDQQAKTLALSKDQTATSGIFKTASGWQDGKYYALMDKVDPGTIIRIINPTNNKAVYAKVLGEMSGIRQNQGMELRISNAAANALQVTDTEKFIVRVIY